MLLSTGGRFSLARGDLIVLAGSVFWALHLVVIGRAVQRVNIFHLSIGQYLVTAALNLAAGLLFEPGQFSGMAQFWWALGYTGIISVGAGNTLQAVAQKHAPPTDAALILSMESVFAAVFGYLTLSEILAPLQILGCVLILAAILIVQLWQREALAPPSS
jgi:drug/metabolite transporter (DMT)-like permease